MGTNQNVLENSHKANQALPQFFHQPTDRRTNTNKISSVKQTGFPVCQHPLALGTKQHEQHSQQDQHFHSLPFRNCGDFALFEKQGDDATALFSDTGGDRPPSHYSPSNGPQTCTFGTTDYTWSHSGLPKNYSALCCILPSVQPRGSAWRGRQHMKTTAAVLLIDIAVSSDCM